MTNDDPAEPDARRVRHGLLTMQRDSRDSHSPDWGPLERFTAHCICGFKTVECWPRERAVDVLTAHIVGQQGSEMVADVRRALGLPESVRRIDPSGCGCTDCITGYSAPYVPGDRHDIPLRYGWVQDARC